MITQLYTFSPGAFVIADEWNANFRSLYQVSLEHTEAIHDANNNVAFPYSDFSTIFERIRAKSNSFVISGDSIVVFPECEYYKDLPDGKDLNIIIPDSGINSEVRVLIRTHNLRTLLPVTITYKGQEVKISFGLDMYFSAGMYYILIYEANGTAQAKLVWTGE